MSFPGFPADTLRFFADLAVNNTRDWFEDNRNRYETSVREPAEAFIMSLGPLLATTYPAVSFDLRRNGAGSLMRLHRDVRFAKDKSPYKQNLGIIFPLQPGKKVEVPMFYFHIDPVQAFFYGGQHVFTPELLQRYRQALDDAKRGSAIPAILEKLAAQDLPLMEDPAYKRVPRGWAADHPRTELLRQAALGVGRNFSAEQLTQPDLVEQCRKSAVAMKPLLDWLQAL